MLLPLLNNTLAKQNKLVIQLLIIDYPASAVDTHCLKIAYLLKLYTILGHR